MRIEHAAMYVNDLEKARDFFIRYFGAVSGDGYHNAATDFRSFFLEFEDGARLEVMNRPDLDDPDRSTAGTGYAHLAFSTGSKKRADLLTKELERDGYRVISGPRTTGDGYYESCISGPEGNLIEITV